VGLGGKVKPWSIAVRIEGFSFAVRD